MRDAGNETELLLEQPAFSHSLQIQVPKLKGYTYELIKIRHGVTLYPLAASLTGEDGPPTRVATREAFEAWLQNALSSPTTRNVITSLMGIAK